MQMSMREPLDDAVHGAGPTITLRQIGAAIARRKRTVILCTLLGAVAAYAMATTVRSKYAAEVALISDASLSGIVEQQFGDPARQADPSATQTIVETIGSNIIIRRAIGSLPEDILQKLRSDANVDEQMAKAVLPEGSVPEALETLETSLISRFMASGLEVNNSGQSYTIYVRYRASDPLVAAAVANAVASAYLTYLAELKRNGYATSLANLARELTTLKAELQNAERTAQTMREQMRLLAARSEALTGRQQDEAIAQSAELFSRQREAEREAEAAAVVYERLLLNERDVQSRIDAPQLNVYLFAPAVVPTRPSGFNAKPAILLLGVLAGFLIGTSIALMRRRETAPKPGAASASVRP